MNIAIIGLGLIGGSYAKSISRYTSHKVYAISHNKTSVNNAIADKAIIKAIENNSLKEMDMVIICLPPTKTIEFIKDNADAFKDGAIISDVSGVKNSIVSSINEVYTSNRVNYISMHPMAGRECSGYINSLATLFEDKSLILIENDAVDSTHYDTLIKLSREIGFSTIVKTTVSEHDKIIAYTSQMCHVLSNAFIKSPTSRKHLGFSGGSFEDLTRVAFLDPNIWTELFSMNREPLLRELNTFLAELVKYRDALENNDLVMLKELLREGREIKEAINNEK